MNTAVGMRIDDPGDDRAFRAIDHIDRVRQIFVKATRYVDIGYLAAAHEHISPREVGCSVAGNHARVPKDDVHHNHFMALIGAPG